MVDFLAENNICGQQILQLVSRGNAIIAEIQRLKDFIPAVFRLDNKQDALKYADIVQDFSYFRVSEAHEAKIEANDELHDLDKKFRDSNIKIISRFYSVFESILTYVIDLNQFITEMTEGHFIHQTMENVLADIEGRQLICESLYLYGTMLLLVDMHIEGSIRERLLVSYYRYTPQRQDTQSSIDGVCMLLRGTGYTSTKKPPNYPEDYFKRMPVKDYFIDVIIGRLRADDIYNQLSVYPLTMHRSVALASQAAMLFVCLFFAPDILYNQASTMREIVDKYFPDNWTVSIYMGTVFSLTEYWDQFRAARTALNNTLETANVKRIAGDIAKTATVSLQETSRSLKEGLITGEYLLSNVNGILALFRQCNVALRWLILNQYANNERHKRTKQLQDLITAEIPIKQKTFFRLLLYTAELELQAVEKYRELLDEKESKWLDMKRDSQNSLTELSEVFGGLKPLSRIEKNANLEKWFLDIAKEVDTLDQSSEHCSRKLVQLIQALQEVEEFHQLRNHAQVIQYLQETRGFLNQMVRTMKIRDDVLINMQIIGDISYAWQLIDTFTPLMQQTVRLEPRLISTLRTVFLKLATGLETPLVRINQAHSADLVSVSQYYSSELETYIRRVLHVVPEMMFERLRRIIELRTNVLVDVPTRLEKDKLREYAQLPVRAELAQLTHSVAMYGEGMRKMKSTLVGIISLDPKQMLEDGIRKELVQHVAKAYHTELKFAQKFRPDELNKAVASLAKIIDGFRKSFEYIEDYICINGLKIWQEEVTRIINYNVEQECKGFLQIKTNDWESEYQSRFVPIPIFPQSDASLNFIGRLGREIIRTTDPKNNYYSEHMSSWYNTKTENVIFDKQTISQIASAIDITGIVGLDRFFSFMIIIYLKKIKNIFSTSDNKNPLWNTPIQLLKTLEDTDKDLDYCKLYQNCISRTSKMYSNLFEYACIIGQLQILRRMLNHYLNSACHFNVRGLETSLRTLNKSLMNDILRRNEDEQPSEELLYELSKYFEYAGLSNPTNKLYIGINSNRDYATQLFMCAISAVPKLYYPTLSLEMRKGAGQIDSVSFCMGMHTILKQFHSELNDFFIQCASRYVMHVTNQGIRAKSEVLVESHWTVQFLKQYCKYSEHSKTCFDEHFPEEIRHIMAIC